MAKRKAKRDKEPRFVPYDAIEDALVQVLADAVEALGRKKDGARWRLGPDPAESLLRLLVKAEGKGVALAELIPAGRARLSSLLRALLDLQRCGLVEVAAGTARVTALGREVAAARRGRRSR